MSSSVGGDWADAAEVAVEAIEALPNNRTVTVAIKHIQANPLPRKR